MRHQVRSRLHKTLPLLVLRHLGQTHSIRTGIKVLVWNLPCTCSETLRVAATALEWDSCAEEGCFREKTWENSQTSSQCNAGCLISLTMP